MKNEKDKAQSNQSHKQMSSLYKEKNLTVPVIIAAQQLGDHVSENIIKCLLAQTTGKCMEDVGFVEDIISVQDVFNHKIQSDGGKCVFNVECTAKVIDPKPGDVVNAMVTCYMHGKAVIATFGPLHILAKWSPGMEEICEGKCYDFEILDSMDNNDHIACVSKLIISSVEK